MYEIIEDASPYYITFKFLGLTELIEYIKTLTPELDMSAVNYFNRKFNSKDGHDILSKLPMYKDFPWVENRVSIFKTPPGRCSSIHKDSSVYRDGTTWDKVGMNISLTVLDDQCVTKWYSDETFKNETPWGWPYAFQIRLNPKGYDGIPTLKETVFGPNQITLINLDFFHSWENNKSKNVREVLTLRFKPEDNINFFNARKTLFGY